MENNTRQKEFGMNNGDYCTNVKSKNNWEQQSSNENTIHILEMLKVMFPHFKSQIQDAIHAYECPFEHFCKLEARYRMDEMEFSNSNVDEQNEIESEIARKLFNSESYLDNDVACQIVEEVTKSHVNHS